MGYIGNFVALSAFIVLPALGEKMMPQSMRNVLVALLGGCAT